MSVARCRDCKFYDLDAVRSKSGAILSNRAARCLWQSTEVWPISVASSLNRRPTPSHMEPNEGAQCQVFNPRGDAGQA
jgi:hypothetical protein